MKKEHGGKRQEERSTPARDAKPAGLTPRPRLLIALSVVMAAWVVYLLVLYFWTVYPSRG